MKPGKAKFAPLAAWLAGVLVFLSLHSVVLAQATRPTTPIIPLGKHENQPLRLSPSAAPASQPIQRANSETTGKGRLSASTSPLQPRSGQ